MSIPNGSMQEDFNEWVHGDLLDSAVPTGENPVAGIAVWGLISWGNESGDPNVLVAEVGEDGSVQAVMVNDEAETHFGYTKEEWYTLPNMVGTITHSDDIDLVREGIRSSEDVPYQARFKKKGEEDVDAEWYRLYGFTVNVALGVGRESKLLRFVAIFEV